MQVVRQTELLIVHVAALGGSRLLVGRRRRRFLGSATVEHDSRDLAQSGRIDQRVVSWVEDFLSRCKCNENGCREERAKMARGAERIKTRL